MREELRPEGGEERSGGGWRVLVEEREGCEERPQGCGGRGGGGPGLGPRGGRGGGRLPCGTSNSPASASPPEHSLASECSSWQAAAWLFYSVYGPKGNVHRE